MSGLFVLIIISYNSALSYEFTSKARCEDAAKSLVIQAVETKRAPIAAWGCYPK